MAKAKILWKVRNKRETILNCGECLFPIKSFEWDHCPKCGKKLDWEAYDTEYRKTQEDADK